MCGYLLHFFSLFCKDTNFPSFSAAKRKEEQNTEKEKKTIRKDDPNQLSINEINALQTEQSN